MVAQPSTKNSNNNDYDTIINNLEADFIVNTFTHKALFDFVKISRIPTAQKTRFPSIFRSIGINIYKPQNQRRMERLDRTTQLLQAENVSKTVNKTATQVNNLVADKIREKIDDNFRDLHNAIREVFDKLQEFINAFVENDTWNRINEILAKLQQFDPHITTTIPQLFEKLENYINDFKKNIKNKIINTNTKVNTLNDNIDDLKTTVSTIDDNVNTLDTNVMTTKNKVNSLTTDLQQIKETILLPAQNKLDAIKTKANAIKSDTVLLRGGQNEIIGLFATTSTGIITSVGAEIATAVSAIEAALGVATGAITAEIAGVSTLISSVETTLGIVKTDVESIKNQLSDDNLKKLIKESIKDWYEENSNEIIDTVSLNLSESIVGESYIKYDSSTSYWPTLIFKFKSTDKNLKYNYSQIKIRYYKKPDEITDSDILNLKTKLKNLNIFYTQGNLRANYVDENRLFRTTIYVANKATVINLLNEIIPIGLLKFNENQLSYTEKNERVNIAKRGSSLNNIDINVNKKFVNTQMKLSSVFLQINGLEKQTKLY